MAGLGGTTAIQQLAHKAMDWVVDTAQELGPVLKPGMGVPGMLSNAGVPIPDPETPTEAGQPAAPASPTGETGVAMSACQAGPGLDVAAQANAQLQ